MNATPFTARVTYALKSDQYLRIYTDQESIYFVRIAGQPLAAGVAAGLRSQLGLLGAALGAGLLKRAKKKIAELGDSADQSDYRTLVMTDKLSFKKHRSEIRSSEINSAEAISGHGLHEGVWRLELTDGKKLRLQFEEVADMQAAIDVLPNVLGDLHTANVVWDDYRQVFQKAR